MADAMDTDASTPEPGPTQVSFAPPRLMLRLLPAGPAPAACRCPWPVPPPPPPPQPNTPPALSRPPPRHLRRAHPRRSASLTPPRATRIPAEAGVRLRGPPPDRLAHLARGQPAGLLDQPVGESRFAMVDMGDDGKIANMGLFIGPGRGWFGHGPPLAGVQALVSRKRQQETTAPPRRF